MAEQYNYLFKICLFADKDAGKETLAKSNVFKSKYEYYRNTTGVNFATKTIKHSGEIIKIQLWIISDEKERFQGIWRMFIRGSLGVILMYDITNAKTLSMVSEWSQMVKDCRIDIPILLVGNKIDLEEQREVSKDSVDTFKENHDISSSMEISLKTGENLEKMFKRITRMALKNTSRLEVGDRRRDESFRNLTPLKLEYKPPNLIACWIILVLVLIICILVAAIL